MINKIDPIGPDETSKPIRDSASAFVQELEQHLEVIYPGADLEAIRKEIQRVCDRYSGPVTASPPPQWNQADAVLICYGDNVHDKSRPTLDVLREFLLAHDLKSVINIVHLLPINPYTSDDGFSVVDYRQVDERLGDWSQIDKLHENFDLMLDLVLNHCSQHSDWFQRYLNRQLPFTEYFVEASPDEDLSKVVRPRNLPLLTEKQTVDGVRSVWTTFSEDQVDLNFACPQVLAEFIDILLLFASHGARIIRLDAIAFLWKEIGTPCIHLPQTHEIVKLMRTVIGEVAPQTLLLTETNVPHAENISYFGDGDEAQMVYQFSLPPLMLDAYLQQNTRTLGNWLKTVCESPAGTTFFNFTASHDGIGVRPLEGLVPQENLDRIVKHAVARGGKIGTRREPDGTESPYELNVTYLDMLLTDTQSERPSIDRFMASQAIMLSVKGIPGIYFHSLFGTRNDIEAAEKSQIPRRINRRKFDVGELSRRLADADSMPQRVFERYRGLLAVRKRLAAFHPDAKQVVIDHPNEQLLVFQRVDEATPEHVTVVANFSQTPQTLCVDALPGPAISQDLITGRAVDDTEYTIPAFGIAWLR